VTGRELVEDFPSFNELVGNIIQEESRMISRGIIHKHGEEEPIAFLLKIRRKRENDEHLVRIDPLLIQSTLI